MAVCFWVAPALYINYILAGERGFLCIVHKMARYIYPILYVVPRDESSYTLCCQGIRGGGRGQAIAPTKCAKGGRARPSHRPYEMRKGRAGEAKPSPLRNAAR